MISDQGSEFTPVVTQRKDLFKIDLDRVLRGESSGVNLDDVFGFLDEIHSLFLDTGS